MIYIISPLSQKTYCLWGKGVSRAMTGDQERRDAAENLLKMRARRKEYFPNELFDECAWTILLILFVSLADDQAVSETDLLASAGISVGAGRRWLNHLVQDGQVEQRNDGGNVILSDTAVAAMRGFLDQQRAV
jgi:hypothetical protein